MAHNIGVKEQGQITLLFCLSRIIWNPTQENLSSGVCEQHRRRPAHTRRLNSAFVICLLESMLSKLGTGEISIFQLVFVAEETGLSLALLETPKTGFSLSVALLLYKGYTFTQKVILIANI